MALSDADIRRRIYEHVLASGSVPSSAEIAANLSLTTNEVRDAFSRLADAHILVLQRDGEILMAPPFSAVPTPFVAIASEIRAFGNCIWDALGILVALRRDGSIETACGCCSTAMTLHVRDGELQERDGIVHYAVRARQWWDDIVFT